MYKHEWKQWFAWRPVYINDKKYWFKTIFRRKVATFVKYDLGRGMLIETRWEYGTILDVIGDNYVN